MKYPKSESSVLEYKVEVPKKDQILKTIVGFCNRHGGQIVIGVDDDANIVGLSAEKVDTILEFIDKSIHDATSPPIIPVVFAKTYGDKILLIIKVSSGMSKPYYIKSKGLNDGTYIRLGRSTTKASPEMLEELERSSKGISYESEPVYQAEPDELATKKILEFLNTRNKKPAVKHVTNALLKTYGLEIQTHDMRHPTIAGILLFGSNPQKFVTEAMILCNHFAGNEGRKSIASRDCEGTLFEQFENAHEFIFSRLNSSFIITGSKREEVQEIPEEAVRETLLNAIVHRNYSINAPIKIAIYSNRIEIFSPGGFPGPLDLDNLMQGVSYFRNVYICKAFREAGYIEKLGSGIIEIYNSYKKRKLDKPTIIEGANHVKYILPRETTKARPSSHDIQSELDNILDLFNENHEISISDIIEKFDIRRTTAGRRLLDLIEEGLIYKVGIGKGAKYRRS